MANRLQSSISPYLLQHAENPVDWYPWGLEALQKAKKEDKPIFLSIGYAACHWCHVMAHESFEDPQTARIMNEHFINIKVDREERPDLDQIYMDAVVALTGQGGWPMSVFLTSEGRPFYGGTYFPPVQRFNMPSFMDILHSIAQAWQNDRAALLENAEKLVSHVSKVSSAAAGKARIDISTLEQAMLTLAQNYDWQHGGWGRAPKFPQPMLIEFLLQRAAYGDSMALEIAEHALTAMAQGGMYDVIGGGFARYSTDKYWLVPHFEKMLYDNAMLARCYLYAHLLTEDVFYRQICEETLDFTLRELTNSRGGFYSSLDADSDGEEGKYYVWDLEEITNLLPEQTAKVFVQAYGITAAGNFEGQTVLQRQRTAEQLAAEFSCSREEIEQEIASAKEYLLHAREQRVRPATDDKVLTGWNGLMLRTMAEAAAHLDREDYLAAAQNNAAFLINELWIDRSLQRVWRAGQSSTDGFLEDHASLIVGLLALYQVDFNEQWFQAAAELADQMIFLFTDQDGGFYDTSTDQEQLFVRPKTIQDSAVPCGNSLAAYALLQLAALTGDLQYYDRYENMAGLVSSLVERFPTAIGNWLVAVDFANGPIYEVAILTPDNVQSNRQLIAVYREQYRPHTVIACSSTADAGHGPALLHDRPLVNQKPTAYVCQGFVCRQPVTGAEDLRQQLSAA